MKRIPWIAGLALVAGMLLASGCGSSADSVGSGGGGGGGGGGDSVPQVTSLDPPGATAGGPGFTLTVNGTGFVATSAVNWSGSPRITTVQSSTVVTATIAAADVAATGSAAVTVVNPAQFGSITSNSINFPINPAVLPPPTGAGVVALVSAATDGSPGNRQSDLAAISSNGRFVAFSSLSSNFSSASNNGFYNVFLRDTCTAAPSGCTPSIIPVSVAPDGSPGNGDSGDSIDFATYPAMSSDGRYVAFASTATNLTADVTGGFISIFLRDTCTGVATGCTPATVLVSAASDGTPGNGDSVDVSISSDGRFVVFDSDASNLVVSDTNASTDIFLRDTCNGAAPGCMPSTTLISVASDGTQGNQASLSPAISGGGRFVAFQSYATNLVPNDTSLFVNVFVRDTCLNAPAGCVPSSAMASVGPGGVPGNEGSDFPTISADGRFVTFPSFATNLVSGTALNTNNVFVRDTCAGVATGCTPVTALVSVSPSGLDGNGASGLPSISSAGRFIAFNSDATNLVIGDTNGYTDVFVRDTCAGAPVGCVPATVIVSITPAGTQGNFNSSIPAISADGHFVAFGSGASNLLPIVAPINVFLAATSF